MYRQLQGLGKKQNDMYKNVYCKNSHLGLLKLMRTRKCWARDCVRRTDLGASSAFWQKTDNDKSKHLPTILGK
jgi:hypothetical protein